MSAAAAMRISKGRSFWLIGVIAAVFAGLFLSICIGIVHDASLQELHPADAITPISQNDRPFEIRMAAAALILVRKTRRFRSEEHTSELQSLRHLVCRLLLEKKNKMI